MESPAVLEADDVSPARLLLAASVVPLVVGLVVSLFRVSAGPVLIGLALTAIFLLLQRNTIRHQYQWQQPTLELRSHELQLGESVQWTYKRASRNPVDVADARVTLTLTCREEATYTQGSDRRTSMETVAEVVSQGAVHGTATGLQASGIIVVPTNMGAPTMKLRNNVVRWGLEAHLDGHDLPGGSEDFDVVVIPVLDAGMLGTPEIQDTVS